MKALSRGTLALFVAMLALNAEPAKATVLNEYYVCIGLLGDFGGVRCGKDSDRKKAAYMAAGGMCGPYLAGWASSPDSPPGYGT